MAKRPKKKEIKELKKQREKVVKLEKQKIEVTFIKLESNRFFFNKEGRKKYNQYLKLEPKNTPRNKRRSESAY